MMLQLAEEYARKYHEGQFRKKNHLPYIVHPEGVVHILEQRKVQDEEVLSMGWLHDTLEDTTLSYEEVERVFGSRVAKGVYILTRNVEAKEYKERLAKAATEIQLVKLADTLDNLKTLEDLSPRGIERKVVDCQEFYVPLASRIFPLMGIEMQQQIISYLWRQQNN